MPDRIELPTGFQSSCRTETMRYSPSLCVSISSAQQRLSASSFTDSKTYSSGKVEHWISKSFAVGVFRVSSHCLDHHKEPLQIRWNTVGCERARRCPDTNLINKSSLPRIIFPRRFSRENSSSSNEFARDRSLCCYPVPANHPRGVLPQEDTLVVRILNSCYACSQW